jgi:protein dithiol:quinone oxidoreductase
LNLNNWPQSRWFGIIALTSLAMLAFGLVLQHGFGLEPCPMCIVQRYAMFMIALCAGLAWASSKNGLKLGFSVLTVLFALTGAAVAARQSWLQWYPPEIVSCGRDFYGMVENLPIKRALPMIFAGSGDCTKIDWTFLRLSIANWAFLYFVAVALLATWVSFPRRIRPN